MSFFTWLERRCLHQYSEEIQNGSIKQHPGWQNQNCIETTYANKGSVTPWSCFVSNFSAALWNVWASLLSAPQLTTTNTSMGRKQSIFSSLFLWDRRLHDQISVLAALPLRRFEAAWRSTFCISLSGDGSQAFSLTFTDYLLGKLGTFWRYSLAFLDTPLRHPSLSSTTAAPALFDGLETFKSS